MAVDNRTIKELSTSGVDNAAPLCIQYPVAAQGKTDEFKLKSSLLHHIPKFHGLSKEDPNKHLKEFEVVCLSITPVNVDGSILKMKAFPFSLLEKAKDWLYELALETATSWESMKRAFLEKFFSTSRVILLRKRISGIQQNQGFLPIERQMLDALAEGALVDKTPMAANTLIANRALNAQQYEGVGQIDIPRKQNVNEGQQHQNKTMLNQAKEVDELKKQMGQIKEQGKLPSTTIVNPRGGFESVKAITLRSGKEVGTDPQPSKSAQTEDQKLQQEEDVQHTHTARKETTLPCTPTLPNPSNLSTTGKKGSNSVNSNVIPPNAPFPHRFMQTQNEESEKDILETFRKVQVNIPLLDAIKQIPKYAKFLKKLCTTRNRIREKEVVHVNENVSAMLQRKLPPKCKDPDFYVLDMEDAAHSPPPSILPGRPLMKTTQTKIDVANGALTMAFGGDMIHFKIPESNVNLTDVRSCFAIDVVENIGQEPSAPTKKDEFQPPTKRKLEWSTKNTPLTFKCIIWPKAHLENLLTVLPLHCNTLVPNRIQAGGNDYIDLRMLNAPIGKDYYPLPFIEPMYEYFEEHAVDDIPLHAVGPIQA
ncbi:uncharacterized protein [Malus domestica]|uniref:uncharacterized protein n=1 Tax=Malus domestica TaxID=3750 RepID=UPI0039762FBA